MEEELMFKFIEKLLAVIVNEKLKG